MRLFNQLSACRQMFAYGCMFYVRRECTSTRTFPMLGCSHSCVSCA